MSGPVEDAKRNLERKPDGSNPEPPYKKHANTDEEEVTPKWAMQLMTKVDGMELKLTGVKESVDSAVVMAAEAKENVKKLEVEVTARVREVKEDIGRETKDRKEWQASMEEKIAAAEYKDAVEVKPTDPEIQNKINQIEKQLAGWSTSTPGASTGTSTIVWGGFDKDGDGAAEIEWVESSVEQLGLVAPASTYFWGEKFKCMLFFKCQKASKACKALDALSKIKLEYGSKEVRCKLDAPY